MADLKNWTLETFRHLASIGPERTGGKNLLEGLESFVDGYLGRDLLDTETDQLASDSVTTAPAQGAPNVDGPSVSEDLLEEALRLYALTETPAQARQVFLEHPVLLSLDAFERMKTMYANALIKGDYILAQDLDDKYQLLIECAKREIISSYQILEDFLKPFHLDISELSAAELQCAALVTGIDPTDDSELTHEFRDDVLRAMWFGLLANRGDPKMWDESIRLLEQSLSKPSIHRYPELRADIHSMLGFYYLSTPLGDREGNLHKAVECYGETSAFYSGKPDRWEYANAQGNLGAAYAQTTKGDRIKNLRRCMDCQTEALKVYTLVQYPQDYAAAQYNLAVASIGLANFYGTFLLHTAIRRLKEVQKVDRRDSSPVNYAMVQNSLGNIYRKLISGNQEQNLRQAVDCYLDALQIFESKNLLEEYTKVTVNLGRAYTGLASVTDTEPNLRQAIECYDKALMLRPADEIPVLFREIQSSRGDAYRKLVRLTESTNDLRESIRAFRESLDPYRPGFADLDAFNAAQALGDIAWDMEIWRSVFGTDSQMQRERQQIAVEGYLRAVRILDNLLAGATSADQAFWIEQTTELHQRLIKVTCDLGLIEDCLVTMERAKGRLLLHDLAQTDFHAPAAVPHSMKREEQNLMERSGHLRQWLREAEEMNTFIVSAPKGFVSAGKRTASGGVTKSSLWQELDTVEFQLQDLYRQMEPVAPDYGDIRRAATPDIADIRRFVRDQGQGTTLLSYYTLLDSTLLLGLTADDNLIAEKIHTSLPVLTDKLDALLNPISLDNPFVWPPEFPDDPDPLMLPDLSAALLPERLQRLLEQTSRLYVIPSGPLHWLPFQALLWRGDPLLCHFPVIQSPSISVAIRAQQRHRGGRLSVAAFGFAHKSKQKSKFEGEARQIARILGGKANVGRQSNRASVHKLAQDAQVLHISSHGHFDPSRPLVNSGLDLADGRLTGREVMEKLHLPGSLVTLSACETGYNALQVGDELIGLMRAFFYAGASSLVLSMWPVDAATTMDLMTVFYESSRRGESRAAALRTAALAIRDEKPHPFYWAPFVLLGDWK